MALLLQYFREHPWQRRALTALLAVVLGLIAALAWYPRHVDRELLEQLKASDPATVDQAVDTATSRARQKPRFRRLLETQLATKDNGQFLAILQILERLDRFHIPERDPRWYDRETMLRFRALQYTATDQDSPALARSRSMLVYKLLASGRDHSYIHKTMQAAISDRHSLVRIAAADLAGTLGQWELLETLLVGEDPQAAEEAALLAAAANHKELSGFIADRLYETIPEYQRVWTSVRSGQASEAQIRQCIALRDLAGTLAYALCRLDASTYGPGVTDILRRCDDPALVERLAVALVAMDSAEARQCCWDLLSAARRAGRYGPGVLYHAAQELNVPEAAPFALDLLREAGRAETTLSRGQVIGAVEFLRHGGVACPAEVAGVARRHWAPPDGPMLVAIARLLAHQAQASDDSVTSETLQALLRQAALFEVVLSPEETSESTPYGSAAAAAELWLLHPTTRQRIANENNADEREGPDRSSFVSVLRQAAAREDTIAGDHIAWRLGRTDLPEVWDLSRLFLPERDSAPPEYNAAVRNTGMLLAALMDSSPNSHRVLRQLARQGRRGDLLDRGTTFCARLMAGDTEAKPAVRELFGVPEFPMRRACMALLLAGDRWVLDRLVFLSADAPEELARLLIDRGLNDVLADVAPSLPRPWPAASTETRAWQVRIFRTSYLLQRERLWEERAQ